MLAIAYLHASIHNLGSLTSFGCLHFEMAPKVKRSLADLKEEQRLLNQQIASNREALAVAERARSEMLLARAAGSILG